MPAQLNSTPLSAQRRNPSQLREFFASVRDRPFKWGVWDCVIFASSAVEALGGPKTAPQVVWYDEGSAGAEIAKKGGLMKAVEKACSGLAPVEGKYLPGDVVLYEGRKGLALGIWDGWAVKSPSRKGLATHHGAPIRGWRVK